MPSTLHCTGFSRLNARANASKLRAIGGFALITVLAFGLDAFECMAQSEKSITNADVVELVKAGLPDSTILLLIETSRPEFDLSADALEALKAGGVSDELLDSIEGSRAAGKASNAETSHEAVFLLHDGMRVLMETAEKKSRWASGGFLVRLSTVSYILLEGLSAQLIIGDKTPAFEASLPADVNATEKLKIVRLKPKKKRKVREIEDSHYTLRRNRDGFGEKDVVATVFEEVRTYIAADGVKYTLYRVRPAEPLQAGEYAFVPRGSYWEFYDFGVAN